MTFYEGDRVRLGAVRGGLVVRVNGLLRVRFGDAKPLLWLDYMVPDEGPDGPIFPNEWDPCETCGNPSVSWCCVNCERRAQREFAAFDRSARARENREAIANGEPSFGIHVAGPVERTGRTVAQRCARCGATLRSHIGDIEIGLFPVGALVERGGLGGGGLITPPLRGTTPTCQPFAEPRVSLKRPA